MGTSSFDSPESEVDVAMPMASRAAVERALNARLPSDRQVVFARDRRGDRPSPWGMAPVQAEGTIGMAPFYFRFRNNRAALTVYGSTADEADVYPGEPYAGWFETVEDMVGCFARLADAQAPVHPLENPTTVQRMESGMLQMRLAQVAGDLAAEEAVFTGDPDSEVAAAAYANWLRLPEVAEWVAAGRPDPMA